jgi:hypothetical protein
MANAKGYANILYWSFIKCKRIIKSVLAFKLYAMAYGFDISALIKFIIDKVLKIDLLLIFYINSKSLYKCLVKLDTTQEKRLIIDIMCFC